MILVLNEIGFTFRARAKNSAPPLLPVLPVLLRASKTHLFDVVVAQYTSRKKIN